MSQENYTLSHSAQDVDDILSSSKEFFDGGKNADKLDGKHASDFALATELNSALNEAKTYANNISPFIISTSAPSDIKKLWIDLTANTGGLKYWNGSAWTHVPVAYT